MVIDGAAQRLVNVGCPVGLNSWIRHRAATVEMEFDAERRLVVAAGEWRRAVCAFSDAIARFFEESPPKQPGDHHDRDWYTAFQAEWRRRRRGR